MSNSRISAPRSWLGNLVVLAIVFAFVGVISSCLITIGIWPGQIKLLAPIFCTDAQPDAFVVSDTFQRNPGETVTNFTLYCMGPRGDATDHGFLRPFLLISVVNGLIIFGIGAARSLFARTRRNRRDEDSGTTRRPTSNDDHSEASAAPPGSTAGPFVE